MTYPIIVTVIAVLAIAVIMIFVVPTFSSMFASMGGTLPMPTLIIIRISNFIGGWGGLITARRDNWPWYVPEAVQAHGKRSASNRQNLAKTAYIRGASQQGCCCQIHQALRTLTSSGVPILDGLEITAKTARQ